MKPQSDEIVRPRMRQDVAFLQTLEGVYVRGHDGAFVIRGAGAYQYLSALLPHLDGGSTMADIVSGLPEAHAGAVRALLGTLATRGVVIDGPDPRATLDAGTRTKYESQLALLDHYGDDGSGFARAAAARVLVVGDDDQATSTLRSALTANGVGSAETGFVRSCAVLAADSVAGAGVDLLCLIALDAPAPDLFSLAAAARSAGISFVPLLRVGDTFMIGPLQAAAGGASIHSALLRMSDNAVSGSEAIWQAAVAGGSAAPAAAPLPAAARSMVVNLAGFEIFKTLTGRIEADLDGRVIRIDPLRLTARTEPLLAHPAVSTDTVRHPAIEVEATRSEVEAAYRRFDPVVADTVGLLRRFDDDAMPQIPVKTAVLLAPAAASEPIVTFGVETVLEARLTALEQASAAYAVATHRRCGSLAAAAGDAEPVAAAQLDSWLGVGPARPTPVAATDQASGLPLAIDQAAVLAGPADWNAAEFEPGLTGVRAAPSFTEAAGRALLDAVGAAAVADVVRAEVPLGEVSDELLAEVLAASDSGQRISMLRRELTEEGCEVRLYYAAAIVPVAVAIVRDGKRERRIAKAGGSWLAALEAVLLELVGLRQIAGTPFAVPQAGSTSGRGARPEARAAAGLLETDLGAAILAGPVTDPGVLTAGVGRDDVLASLAADGRRAALVDLTPPDLAGITAIARSLLFRPSTADPLESR